MFFVKLNHIVTSCFIKLSKFISFSKHKTIYKANNNANALYIILGGKVKLIHSEKGFKKICAPGETFSEELLFQDPSKRRSLESARAYTKVFLIEMSMENYKIMC